MARGWESKSVEAQQLEAAEPPCNSGRACSFPANTCCNSSRQHETPATKKMLQDALADLDSRLARLG